jgi:hypothetical protein
MLAVAAAVALGSYAVLPQWSKVNTTGRVVTVAVLLTWPLHVANNAMEIDGFTRPAALEVVSVAVVLVTLLWFIVLAFFPRVFSRG